MEDARPPMTPIIRKGLKRTIGQRQSRLGEADVHGCGDGGCRRLEGWVRLGEVARACAGEQDDNTHLLTSLRSHC